MPNSEQFYLAILGTLICLMGFLRWPHSSLELSRPRFIVPLIIWMATFYQIFWRYYSGSGRLTSNLGEYRQQFGAQAEIYIIACILAFWVGFGLFHFDGLANRLNRAAIIQFHLDDNKLLSWSLWLAIIVVASTTLLIGPDAIWNNASQSSVYGITWIHFSSYNVVLKIFRQFIDTLFTIASAAMLGLGWPVKEQRNGMHYLIGATILIFTSIPFAADFSRGTGLPVVVAIAVYAFKRRRILWSSAAIGAIWTIIVMNVALYGRGNFGHYAGLYPWGQQFLITLGTILNGDFSKMLTTINVLIDALTPTSVCMAGMNAGHTLGRMSLTNWLLYQLPYPHFLLPTVKYTVNATRFLGGVGHWGYTSSAFGEAWIEFQWFGFIPFIFMGMVYRFIDRLAGIDQMSRTDTISFFVLMLPISYIAMYLGMFSDFRSWWTVTAFGFYFLAGSIYLKNQFGHYSADFIGEGESI